jgi:hypothetical protein
MSEKSENNIPILPPIKKRGRKPKNKAIENKPSDSPVNSEEEPIIVHLPISLEDVVNVSNDDDSSLQNKIFIKSEKDLLKQPKPIVNNTAIGEEQLLKQINQKLMETEKIFMLGKSVNKVNVHNIKFKQGTKCLWCKHSFDTPPVELPEDYFNLTFYCTGNFCSWNCAKSFNIDINDSDTWKRESLLNLMYFKTYGEFKEIIPAPTWLMLEDFGGLLNIVDFRKLFEYNNKDYLVLHPPLITRQLQIEESYKKSNNNNMMANKLENIYDGELVLKRNKPIESNNFNLEKTMGLVRKTKKFEAIAK